MSEGVPKCGSSTWLLYPEEKLDREAAWVSSVVAQGSDKEEMTAARSAQAYT